MTKEEAAVYLDVSKRTLERLMAKDEITYRHIPGPRGIVAEFDQADLDRYKEKAKIALAVKPPALPRHVKPADVAKVADKEPALADINLKLTLTIAEAARLSGVGVGTLEDATAIGMLHSLKIGQRGARVVRRSDLEQYVAELFERGGQSSTD